MTFLKVLRAFASIGEAHNEMDFWKLNQVLNFLLSAQGKYKVGFGSIYYSQCRRHTAWHFTEWLFMIMSGE